MLSITISHNTGLYSQLDVSEGCARSQKIGWSDLGLLSGFPSYLQFTGLVFELLLWFFEYVL